MSTTFTLYFRAVAVGALFATLAATAAVTPNPYGRISEINVFRLQTPVREKIKPEPLQRRTLPKIFITGLIEVGGVPRALVEIAEPGKPVQRSILAAGGMCDVLEILQIDVAAERIRARIDGAEETLSIQQPRPPAVPPPMPPMPLPFRPPAAVRG